MRAHGREIEAAAFVRTTGPPRRVAATRGRRHVRVSPRDRTRAHARTLIPFPILLAVAAAPHALGAQADEPSTHTFSLGVHHFLDDGESGVRIGAGWLAGDRMSVHVTGRAWGGYDVVEPELRWLPFGPARPYAAASGIWQRHGDRDGRGLAVEAGGHWPLAGTVYATVGLGWRSLFRDASDSHWFRLRGGLAVHF